MAKKSLLDDFPRGVPGRDREKNTAPNAQFMDPDEILDRFSYNPLDGDRYYLGRYIDGQHLGVAGIQNHNLLCAGSRGGKGVSSILTNCLSYRGSMLQIDSKGGNARLTARHRAEELKQTVYPLDPFRVAVKALGQETARFNPLSILTDSDNFVANAGLIAEAIVDRTGEGDPFWNDAAQDFLEATILHVATWPDYEGRRNLVTVRELIRQGTEATDEVTTETGMHVLYAELAENDAAGGVISAAGGAMAELSDKERSGVLSTTRRHTKFIDLPQMQDVLSGHDFDLADLKRDKVTVYLCLPSYHMKRCHRWLRLFVILLLQAMEQEESKPDLPVLMLLDEFATLGRVDAVQVAAGEIAEFSVRLMIVLQNLGQIKRLYGDSWETFVANAGILQFFANNDVTTLEWIARRLGQTGVVVKRDGPATAAERMKGRTGEMKNYERSQLVTIDEAARLFGAADPLQRQLVLLAGENPMVLQRAKYYSDRPFSEFV